MAISTIHTGLNYALFEKTTDTEIVAGKTYYEIKQGGIYTKVENPVKEQLANYYELGEMERLVCITDYPDMGGEPEQIEATTLCDEKQTFVDGVEQQSTLTFNANYEKADFDRIYALKGKVIKFGLYLGKENEDGKFEWQGTLNVYLAGAGVNEVRKMVITITPRTPVENVD